MFLSWNKAPSAWFGDLLGLRGQKHSEALGSTRKHSEAQRNSGTHKWCPATAEEKWKDVIEILVLFCSPLLERQSQPEKMRASGRKRNHCIRSRFVLRDNLSPSVYLTGCMPRITLESMFPCNSWKIFDFDVLGMRWRFLVGPDIIHETVRHPLRFREAQRPVPQLEQRQVEAMVIMVFGPRQLSIPI